MWPFATDEKGYGRCRTERLEHSAHRLAWLLEYGSTVGLVMHTCDVPACVNPGHLRAGTPARNSADMKAKRRSPLGARNGQAKLTESDVRAIRTDTRPKRDVAATYGISVTSLNRILRRAHQGGWAWVA